MFSNFICSSFRCDEFSDGDGEMLRFLTVDTVSLMNSEIVHVNYHL